METTIGRADPKTNGIGIIMRRTCGPNGICGGNQTENAMCPVLASLVETYGETLHRTIIRHERYAIFFCIVTSDG